MSRSCKDRSAIICTFTLMTHSVGHGRWLLSIMLLDACDILPKETCTELSLGSLVQVFICNIVKSCVI